MPVALSWMPWIFLSVAILFEVAGITSMKLSRGFAELLPSIGVFVFYICSAAAVILALRRLELSVAYAIWSGVGTALTAMIALPISGSRSPSSSSPRSVLWCSVWSA
jgi:small multidrug resistance pump